eukprot:TRINITY_DN6718_c0_g3_i1.p1 TRINITY_DN6718_c0_g3~~TRINITY_DN6718_c0_g3_i1.p1  ORF type:complete len:184 (+),score=29.92 TRINITY_DN6718_c0_g3_i1:19-570(+)
MAVDRTIPLFQRKYDLVYILVFATMLFIAYTVDIIAALNPSGTTTNPGITAAVLELRSWPPKFLYETNLWWCATYDPVWCVNPVWMKVLATLSPVVYAPFYMFAIYAFIRGRNWIRTPAIMWACAMIVGMCVIMAEEYLGDHKSYNFSVAGAANAPWFFFPFFVLLRVLPWYKPFNSVRPKSA